MHSGLSIVRRLLDGVVARELEGERFGGGSMPSAERVLLFLDVVSFFEDVGGATAARRDFCDGASEAIGSTAPLRQE